MTRRQLQCGRTVLAAATNEDKVTRVVPVTPLSRPRPFAHALSFLRRPVLPFIGARFLAGAVLAALFPGAEASFAGARFPAATCDKETASWRSGSCAVPRDMKEAEPAGATSPAAHPGESGQLVRVPTVSSAWRHGVQRCRMLGVVALSMCNLRPPFLSGARMLRKFGLLGRPPVSPVNSSHTRRRLMDSTCISQRRVCSCFAEIRGAANFSCICRLLHTRRNFKCTLRCVVAVLV